MVAGRRNRKFFCFSNFYDPCNHPNLYAVIILGLRIVRPSVTVSPNPRASSLETERKTGLAISIPMKNRDIQATWKYHDVVVNKAQFRSI